MPERDPAHGQQIIINMQAQGENVTYTATTKNTEDLQRWNKALKQHVYNLSKARMKEVFCQK